MMFKSIITWVGMAITSIVLLLLIGFRSDGYELRGHISGPDGTIIKLSFTYKGRDVTDSAKLINNQIAFKGALPEVVRCTLSNSKNQQIRIFIAENKVMQVTGTVDKFFNLQFQGADQHDVYEKFKDQKSPLSTAYSAELAKSGASRKDKTSPAYLNYQKRVDSANREFVTANAGMAAAAMAIIDSYFGMNEREKAADLYRLLGVDIQKSVHGQRIEQFMNSGKAISPGNSAPDFTLPNLVGKQIKLSDFRNSYVLLDFWASWCPPCRAEHPLLISLQKKYGKKIEFVSVSMDANSAQWKEAVKVDQLSWTQLNDNKSTDGGLADSYGIKSLPFNCIIDPNGKIIAVKKRGADLESFLSTLFDSGK